MRTIILTPIELFCSWLVGFLDCSTFILFWTPQCLYDTNNEFFSSILINDKARFILGHYPFLKGFHSFLKAIHFCCKSSYLYVTNFMLNFIGFSQKHSQLIFSRMVLEILQLRVIAELEGLSLTKNKQIFYNP